MAIAVVCSLLAALLYAAASVLQHRAAVEVDPEHSMRLGLLAKLVAKPWWLAGIAADALAFVLQFIALGHGPLILVQPLLVSGLLFALPLGMWLSHGRIHAGEIRSAALVVAGLALMLTMANPARGRATLSDRDWILLGIAILVPVAALAAGATRSTHRATLLACAAGAVYGLTAALAKTAAHDLGIGVTHALAAWQVWALIPGGALGMLLCQSAFQAGPLASSLPTLTVVDPLVSIAIGAIAFDEHINGSVLHLVFDAIGLAAMVVGVLVLARSPLVALEDLELAHQ